MTTTPNTPALTKGAQLLAAKLTKYPVLDPDDLDERTITRILSAETAEAAAADPDSRGLRDITGVPFMLCGIDGLLLSTVKGHEGEPYMLLRCATEDGVVFTATTGSKFAMTVAMRWDELGVLPRRARSLELANKSDPSTSSLWLVDAPRRADPGQSAAVPAYARSKPTTAPGSDEEPF